MLEVLACVLGLMGSLEADKVDGAVNWAVLDWAPPESEFCAILVNKRQIILCCNI